MSSPPLRAPLRRAGLLAASMLLGLAACTTPFKADVKRFSDQLPAPAGQTFAIVAEDPSDEGGLEFAQYAGLIADQLSRLGYVRAAPDHAAMLVRFDYDIDQGRDRIRSSPGFYDPFWGPWHHGYYGYGFARHGYWGYGWHDPFFFDSGYDIDVVTVYTSGIDLKIDRKADGARLFEGQAQAASRSNNLSYLVPNLVDAMFTDFPGNSGETVRISIAPEKKTVKRID